MAEGSKSSGSLGHVPGLDGLRGVAVLLVVSTHLVFVFWESRTTTVMPGGFLGVELFFVLSGFLITSLLIEERGRSGRIGFRHFYVRRALRLLPALVALLAVHYVFTVLTGADLATENRSLLPVLFYFANWWEITHHALVSGYGHLWSLSVEEQFYIAWPVIIGGLLAWRWGRDHALEILVAVAAILTLRTMWQWTPGTNFLRIDQIYLRTDNQAVCLLCGAAAAFVRKRFEIPARALRATAWVAIAFVGVCAWRWYVTQGFYWRGGLTAVGIAGAVITLAVVNGGWSFIRVLTLPPLRALGRVSYGLYLWHLPVFFEVHRHAGSWPALGQAVLGIVLSSAATVVSWYLVETPFLRRKAALSGPPYQDWTPAAAVSSPTSPWNS